MLEKLPKVDLTDLVKHSLELFFRNKSGTVLTQVNTNQSNIGQWLCLSWQCGRFRHQRSEVRIQSSGNFNKLSIVINEKINKKGCVRTTMSDEKQNEEQSQTLSLEIHSILLIKAISCQLGNIFSPEGPATCTHPSHAPSVSRVKEGRQISVTRLGYFRKFLATKFLSKVAQIFCHNFGLL